MERAGSLLGNPHCGPEIDPLSQTWSCLSIVIQRDLPCDCISNWAQGLGKQSNSLVVSLTHAMSDLGTWQPIEHWCIQHLSNMHGDVKQRVS